MKDLIMKDLIASVVACCAAHPLELIKVRMQLHGEPSAALQSRHHHPISIIHRNGTAALFSGASAAVLRQVLQSAFLVSFISLHRVIQKEDPIKISITDKKEVMAVAAIAGGLLAVFVNPAEVALVRMQADGRLPLDQRRNYKNAVDAIAKMIKNEGFASPWRGTSLAMIRDMVGTPAMLFCHLELEKMIRKRKLIDDGPWVKAAASVGGGVVAVAVSNPVDVIKTRVMNMQAEAAPYRGAVDCAVKTYRAEGMAAFYKGLIPSAMRMTAFLTVARLTLEQLRNYRVNINLTSSKSA